MQNTAPRFVPDSQVCEQARLSRDPRFDGLFFTAVTSTRIYCRPVCPVPTVKRENVRYFPTAAAAENAGFRPCLRCRPELAPGPWHRGDAVLARALKLIDAGVLNDAPMAALAERLAIGERQLRRLFLDRLGTSPRSVHATRRLLFTKQLLTETDLPITQIALEAGFGSVRQFNATFRKAYRQAPSSIRRRPRQAGTEAHTLRLGYRPPYDFSSLLDYLRARAVPGMERVNDRSYSRTFGTSEAPGWFHVSAWPGDQNALQLRLHCPHSVQILDVVTRVRQMFDLDADPEVINAVLASDRTLKPMVERNPGLRIPGAWDGFEIAVRTVLGEEAGAGKNAILARLPRACRGGSHNPFATDLRSWFPTAEMLAGVDSGYVSSLNLDAEFERVLRAMARAVVEGQADFHAERTLEGFVDRWAALPGIDIRTAHYIALRALSHPDAFPGNLAMAAVHGPPSGQGKRSIEDLEARSGHWRPWRAYAYMHLLQSKVLPRQAHPMPRQGWNAAGRREEDHRWVSP